MLNDNTYKFHSRFFYQLVLAVGIAQWSVRCQGNIGNKVMSMARCPPDPQEVERIFKQCRNIQAERTAQEQQLADQGKIILPTERIADISHLRKRNTDPIIRINELNQIPFEIASNKLFKRFGLTLEQITEFLPHLPLSGEYSQHHRN